MIARKYNSGLRHFTGEYRYRTGLFGKIILQVKYETVDDSPGSWKNHWKDANLRDIILEGE
jgi:hypothetical protein